ncbi:MAG: agmatine deiminase family protein, partial [Prevotella conceptionensis]
MATSNNIDIKLYLPAEWHEQSGVQLTWPHAKTDWAPILPDITKVFVELTRAIAKHEKVLIVAPDTDEVKATLMRNLGLERLRNVLFHQCETNDTWARDHAAITLT